MSVTSYLSLYITLLGWEQYQNLWGLAVGTGLIYLPFVSIVIKNTVIPFTSMGAKPACQIALRRLFTHVTAALILIAFAAAPTVHLEPKILHYTPFCTSTAQTATPGHTHTTYDNIFPVPTNVKVPLFWYLVMAISNGITHAASTGLSCAPIHYRQVHTELNLSHIQDASLKQSVIQFYGNCYVPAYSKYISHDYSDSEQAEINQYLKQYGNGDVTWLGSQSFLKVPGFYNTLKATKPVAGFPFDPHRDTEEGQVNNHSQWGEPSCTNWWNDPAQGLHQKLAQALPPNVVESILHLGQKSAALEDAAIRHLIVHSFSNQSIRDHARGYESLNDEISGGYLSRFLGSPIGTTLAGLSVLPKLHLLINALPLIQAALLFAIYTFLALAIPFSSYRIEFCITGAVVMFSLIFMSYIWHLVAWFDHFLIQSLYPSLYGVAGMGGVLNNWLGQPDTNVIFVNMVIGTLYIVLPFFWLVVMGWCGFSAGRFISSIVSSMTGPTSAAGSAAGGAAKTAIQTGISAL